MLIAGAVRVALIWLAAAMLSSCSTASQQGLQARFDRNILNNTVGREYTRIAAQEAMTQEALFGDDRAYGDLFGATTLPSGDTVYRHLERTQVMTSNSDVMGLVGSEGARTDYRLFYFRVGPDGIIKDTANGVVSGESVRCVSYIGGIFQRCGNAQLASTDINQMDAAVTTSTGLPLASWD